jgi:hypothetical protein
MATPQAGRVVALAVVVAALAGCSTFGGGAPTGTTAGIREQVTPIYRELTLCFRAHGYPGFPDPVVKDDGTVEPFSDEVNREIERLEPSLRQHCEDIFNRLPASVREEPSGARARRRSRRRRSTSCAGSRSACASTACPSGPTRTPTGPSPSRSRLRREGKTPRLLNAMRDCRQLNPDPKGGIRGGSVSEK